MNRLPLLFKVGRLWRRIFNLTPNQLQLSDGLRKRLMTAHELANMYATLGEARRLAEVGAVLSTATTALDNSPRLNHKQIAALLQLACPQTPRL